LAFTSYGLPDVNRTSKQLETAPNRYQRVGLTLFVVILAGVVLLKLVYSGWFDGRSPLDPQGQPTLLFFTLSRGCQCQMDVVQAAEAQLANWDVPSTTGIVMLKLDFSRHSCLAHQYKIASAPALLLLNGAGNVVWKQDLGLCDAAPLDLLSAEKNIRDVIAEREYAD
jgi:hypothetical protein